MLKIVSLLLVALAVSQAETLTAKQAVEKIKTKLGVAWREQTVDTFKAGDPDTPVNGIATTMMATFDVLRRAAADGKNLTITHEPVFYSHVDGTAALEKENDPVFGEKMRFIREHNMVVWRFHDHWHSGNPDGILRGVLRVLGWEKQYDPSTHLVTLPETTLGKLAADVEKRLGSHVLRAVGAKDMKVRRVALAPGAAGHATHRRLLQRPDVDVLLIGEAQEWETVLYVDDASAEGRRKALLLAGHIPSEQPGMEECAEWLKTFIGVPVKFIAATDPFWSPR